MLKNKTLVVIAGPTASGKTDLAVRLAKHWNTQILSADSRQCFQEMSIGVAKPTKEEMQGIPHYFIDSHSIHTDINAGFYERYALDALEQIFSQSNVAVAVGGTGLYLKALCEGMDNIPSVTDELRANITQQYQEKGLEWLQHEVASEDPLFWHSAEQANPQRLMRALEIKQFTGKSIVEFRTNAIADRPFHMVKFAIDWKREDLYNRINQRVDNMVAQGLVEEVKSLINFQKMNALQTVGYKEIFQYLNGEMSLDTAIEDIKKNTRHYAKRQITWFKKDLQYQWCSSENMYQEIINKVIVP